jgi:hypothetical protein
MQWSEVIDSPYFKNLPFKIELNRYGKIEMTPPPINTAVYNSILAHYLSANSKKVKCSLNAQCKLRTA